MLNEILLAFNPSQILRLEINLATLKKRSVQFVVAFPLSNKGRRNSYRKLKDILPTC
jgi:hypothetical protein